MKCQPETVKRVQRYCKSHRTVEKTLNQVYKDFCATCGEMQREEFELVLLFLRNRVAKVMQNKCRTYPPDQYEKFTKEQEYVTKGFWNSAHSVKTVFIETAKSVGAITSGSPPFPPAAPLSLDNIEKKCYENLLPGNWEEMTRPQRIDFTKKVHHEGFRQFIFSQDPKIGKFFQQMAKKKNPTVMPVYVTLFSFPAENYSVEARGLLKLFVTVLNDLGRSRLEYVECNEPHVVEIREVRV